MGAYTLQPLLSSDLSKGYGAVGERPTGGLQTRTHRFDSDLRLGHRDALARQPDALREARARVTVGSLLAR